MSAVERLQSAIDKLEQERDERWEKDGRNLLGVNPGGARALGRFVEPDALGLAVTLHGTIDAQLAILRDGIARVHSWTDPDSQVGYEPHLDGPYPPGADATYLALADAILGGEL